MRKEERQVIDMKTILQKITEADTCHLAMCDNGKPYVVPMNFGFNGKNLYFHSNKEGRKIETLRKNSAVCFEVATNVKVVGSKVPCNWSTKYYSIIGEGRAVFVEGLDEKRLALDLIMRKYSEFKRFKYSREILPYVTIIKVEIKSISGKKSGY